MNRQQFEVLLTANPHGFYLDKIAGSGYQAFADLDGAHARAWLEARGYTVTHQYDTGHNGLALTACRVYLSTNGHVSRVSPDYTPRPPFKG